MVTSTHLVVGNQPVKTLVARQRQTNVHSYRLTIHTPCCLHVPVSSKQEDVSDKVSPVLRVLQNLQDTGLDYKTVTQHLCIEYMHITQVLIHLHL